LESPARGDRADFCYAILNGVTLRQIKLSKALFAAADLREADFSGADLREACFYCADLEGANLEGSDLRGADLRGASLNDAKLRRANLSGADLSSKQVDSSHPFAKVSRYDNATGEYHNDTTMVDADFSQAQMTSAQLIGCDLTGAVLDGAAIGGANFSQATLIGASLEDIEIAGDEPFFVDALLDMETKSFLEVLRIDIGDRSHETIALDDILSLVAAHERWLTTKGREGSRLQLDLLQLPPVDLSRRNLALAALRRCLLTDVDLTGANLSLSTLSFSDLSNAGLNEANLSGADLRKANLEGADLTGALLNYAQSSQTSDPRPANLTKIRGDRAILRVAEADHAILYGADLRNANMNLEFLTKCNLEGALLPDKVRARLQQMPRHTAQTSVPTAAQSSETEKMWR